jgi:hypothetical protein
MSTTSTASYRLGRARTADAASALVRWAAVALVTTAFTSAILFGLYILAFYAAALVDGTPAKWNDVLPGLYTANAPGATAGIAVHFAAGGIILVLGGVQFISAIRRHYPLVHRWSGRVYVAAAVLAGAGGLTFIALAGTIGGAIMDVGFGLYGVLMLVAAVPTYMHARARRIDAHRVWALRLFALAIGSWLYRIEYGF